MRELTMHELDEQLAEQLPARELMGMWKPQNKVSQTATATGGNGGDNTSLISPQLNLVNVGIGGDANQINDQSGGDGGDAFAGNFSR